MRSRCPYGLALAFLMMIFVAMSASAESGRLHDGGVIDPSTSRAHLSALMIGLASVGDRARVDAINRFFNRIPHGSDREIWGREDYWATPREFLDVGVGDCEDYAIAKYFALRALGVDAERLAITYARDVSHGGAHMVLLYVPDDGSEIVVLDNRRSHVLPLSQRTDLVPVFGTNSSAVFVLSSARGSLSVKRLSGQRHRQWDELLARRRLERGTLHEVSSRSDDRRH